MGEAPCRAVGAITARNWAQKLPLKKEGGKEEESKECWQIVKTKTKR